MFNPRLAMLSVSLIIFLISASQVHAMTNYLLCTVEPFGYGDIPISPGGFNLRTIINNTANQPFPSSTLNVSIIDPDGRIPQKYFTFLQEMPALSAMGLNGSSYSFTKKYHANDTFDAYFELNKPGTWEIRVAILSEAKAEVLSDGIRRVNECRKYLDVTGSDTYRLITTIEKTNIEAAKLQQSVLQLTLALLVLAIITFLVEIQRRYSETIKKHTEVILGAFGIYAIAVFYNSMGLAWTVGMLFISVVVFLKRTSFGRRRIVRALLFTVAYAYFWVGIFLIMFFVAVFLEEQYVFSMIGITLSFILFIASVYELFDQLTERPESKKGRKPRTILI